MTNSSRCSFASRFPIAMPLLLPPQKNRPAKCTERYAFFNGLLGAMQEGVLAVTIIPHQIREATLAYLLRDEIIALVVSSQTRNLILDVRNVEFMGSVGFLAFLAVRRHLKTGRIVICNLSPTLREMFLVCRLISPDGANLAPFETEATLEAAFARLAE